MLICDDVRAALALQPTTDDPAIAEHLGECEACTKYRRQHQALDVVLRAEMHWQAPTALTARLMAIAAAPELAHLPATVPQRAPIVPARPKTWFVTAVYLLTLAIVALSLLVAWQVLGALTAQVDVGGVLTQLWSLPSLALQYLHEKLPASSVAIDFFLRVRVQLLWLLLVAVLWAVLDKADLQFSFRGRQITL